MRCFHPLVALALVAPLAPNEAAAQARNPEIVIDLRYKNQGIPKSMVLVRTTEASRRIPMPQGGIYRTKDFPCDPNIKYSAQIGAEGYVPIRNNLTCSKQVVRFTIMVDS